MSDCLAGCIGSNYCPSLRDPPNMASLAPWVKVGFNSPDGGITVGNKSFFQQPHEAIIKNFEYGRSNGVGLTIEIFDESGGAFDLFINNMAKNLKEFDSMPKVVAQWGWTGTDCQNSMNNENWTSPPVETVMTNVETSVSEGKIKFIVTCNDLCQPIFAARYSDSYGGDKAQKMHLKDAVEKLFDDKSPKVKVEWLRKVEGGGDPVPWDFGGPGIPPRGPKNAWRSDCQNKLAAAMEWMEPFRTDRNLGIMPTFDTKKNTLIFWEDPSRVGECAGSIGTYIVNGGKCSPVISFSPQINWMVAFGKHGVGGAETPASGEPVQKKPDNKNDENEGPHQTIIVPAQAVDAFMTKAAEETEKSLKEHTKANAIFAQKEAIKAELKIVGDPRKELCGIREVLAKWCSIVVINPFHLSGGGNDCSDWLAQPGCNSYLSNKKWKMTGFCHSISEGSYTTTLSLELLKNVSF